MQILFLTPFWHPDRGGVEYHTLRVAAELVNRGHRLQVLTTTSTAAPESTSSVGHIKVSRIKSAHHIGLWTKLHTWWQIMRHLQLIRQAEVVHIHDVFWWLLPWLPFLNRSKFFITFHGYRPGTAVWKQRTWIKLANWWCRGSIAIGDFQALYFGIQPTMVSYGGIDLVATGRSPALTAKKHLVFMGRLAPDTGIRLYINALAKLSALVQLDVYGDGREKQALVRLSKTKHLPVKFHGWVADPVKYLAVADVVLSSQYLTIIQALALGKPVVAVATNQLKKDYLNQTPFAQWLVIAHDATELQTALQHIRPVSPAAIYWARQQTWSALTDQYEELWQAV